MEDMGAVCHLGGFSGPGKRSYPTCEGKGGHATFIVQIGVLVSDDVWVFECVKDAHLYTTGDVCTDRSWRCFYEERRGNEAILVHTSVCVNQNSHKERFLVIDTYVQQQGYFKHGTCYSHTQQPDSVILSHTTVRFSDACHVQQPGSVTWPLAKRTGSLDVS